MLRDLFRQLIFVITGKLSLVVIVRLYLIMLFQCILIPCLVAQEDPELGYIFVELQNMQPILGFGI
jgi:hypothetical protein